MNIRKIRKEANRLAVKNAAKIIPIYVFVEIILVLLMFVSNEIISIFLSLLSATITHAYIISSLKAVEGQEISVKKDMIVGFSDYGRLFPSYFMRKILINIVSIILMLPTIYLIYSKSGLLMDDVLKWLQIIVVSGIEDITSFSSVAQYLTTPIVIISFVFSSAMSTIISFGLAMMPYLVEKQDISWTEAIMKSWKMMNGHKKELFLLRISYAGEMIFIFIIIQLITSILSFSLYLSTFSSLVLSVYLPIIFYQPHFEMANALFYNELIQKEANPDLFALL